MLETRKGIFFLFEDDVVLGTRRINEQELDKSSWPVTIFYRYFINLIIILIEEIDIDVIKDTVLRVLKQI